MVFDLNKLYILGVHVHHDLFFLSFSLTKVEWALHLHQHHLALSIYHQTKKEKNNGIHNSYYHPVVITSIKCFYGLRYKILSKEKLCRVVNFSLCHCYTYKYIKVMNNLEENVICIFKLPIIL